MLITHSRTHSFALLYRLCTNDNLMITIKVCSASLCVTFRKKLIVINGGNDKFHICRDKTPINSCKINTLLWRCLHFGLVMLKTDMANAQMQSANQVVRTSTQLSLAGVIWAHRIIIKQQTYRSSICRKLCSFLVILFLLQAGNMLKLLHR